MAKVVYASCDEKYFLEHGDSFITSARTFGETVWINIIAPEKEHNRLKETYNEISISSVCNFSISIINSSCIIDIFQYTCSIFHFISVCALRFCRISTIFT